MQVAEVPMNETKSATTKFAFTLTVTPTSRPTPPPGRRFTCWERCQPGTNSTAKPRGDKEDEPIHNDAEKEHLTPDEHFYSKEERHKGFDIIVNAEQHHVEKKRVSFEQVVKLAFPTPPPGQNILYTVTYYNGPKANPEGVITAGQTVKIKNEMVFNVKATDRS